MKFQLSPALQASNLAAGFERSNQILLIEVVGFDGGELRLGLWGFGHSLWV